MVYCYGLLLHQTVSTRNDRYRVLRTLALCVTRSDVFFTSITVYLFEPFERDGRRATGAMLFGATPFDASGTILGLQAQSA
jgi:hypothetical protein